MWPRRSHKLLPLTRITYNKRKFKWTKTKQDIFDEIKWILDRGTLLTYPYLNEMFKIQTDASKFQLGVVIRQKGKQIALYGRKLTYSQKWYTLKEKELLGIIETLKEFKTILLGHKLGI